MNIKYTKSNHVFVAVGILSVTIIIAGSFLMFAKKSASKKMEENSILNLKNDAEDNREQIDADLAIQKNLQENKTLKYEKKISLLFIGDMMFDRYIRQVAEKKGYNFLFQGVDNLLEDNDLVIGNLEGPITGNQSMSASSEFGARENYIFTFDPQVANVLKNHNINLVNISNNHILNFDKNGLEQTKKYLDNSGIRYFCDPDNSELRIANYELQGLKIAFACYNQFESGGEEKTFNDIKMAEKRADLVILYTHWGKEYEMEPLEKTKNLAHKFIDTGVDMIIGTHPHVAQEREVYKNKTIYYSLGNFIFDQYFDPNTTKGLAVKAVIDPENKNINYEEYDLRLKNNGQTELAK